MSVTSSAERLASFLTERYTNQDLPHGSTYKELIKYLIPAARRSEGLSDSPTHLTHWFCSKTTSSLTTGLVTYLIFTWAYTESTETRLFLERLGEVIQGCGGCARGFCAARSRFCSKYISKCKPGQIQAFNAAINKWQSTLIFCAIESLSTSNGTSSTDRTFLGLSSPHLQLLFGMPNTDLIDQNPELKEHIVKTILALPSPPPVSKSLVSLGVLPGFPLIHWKAFSENDPSKAIKLRSWAQVQIRGCTIKPLLTSEWDSLGFASIWKDLVSDPASIEGQGRGEGGTSSEEATKVEREDEFYRWTVVQDILESEVLSKDCLELRVSGKVGSGKKNVLGILEGKLSETNAVFPVFLRVLAALLRANPTSPSTWTNADPSPEFPSTIWAIIHHNPIYIQTLQFAFDELSYEEKDAGLSGVLRGIKEKDGVVKAAAGAGGKAPAGTGPSWSILWLVDFLASVHALSRTIKNLEEDIYEDLLARVANFTFEALQHNRYSELFRSKAVDCGAKILGQCLQLDKPDEDGLPGGGVTGLMKVLDVNASFLVNVVVDHKTYPERIWHKARLDVLVVLYHVMMGDGQTTRGVMKKLGILALDARKREKPNEADRFPVLRIHSGIWAKVYAATPVTTDMIGLLMRGQIRFAHLALPQGNAWSYEQLDFWRAAGYWSKSVTSVVRCMGDMRKGFGEILGPFTAVSDHHTLIRLWSTDRIPESIIRLLLCPDDTVHDAIIGLVAQVFSIDGRAECIRALLCRYPAETMIGLDDHLKRWEEDVNSLPTMVESARWLVRCFTDVIEAMCNGTIDDIPFLRDPAFLNAKLPAGQGTMSDLVYRLWQSMSRVLDSIYKRSRPWSAWHDQEEMVDWMRDALIFGRLMVEETRTFEAAVAGTALTSETAPVSSSPRQATDLGVKMVADLEPVFGSLMSWLRVTEVETLHQSLELIKQLLDCFARHRVNDQVSPRLAKDLFNLGRICHRTGGITKLTDSQLSEVLELISGLYELPKEVLQKAVKKGREVIELDDDTPEDATVAAVPRNAFSELMGSKQPKKPSSSRAKPSSSSSASKVTPIEVSDDGDEEFPDDILDGMSATELERLETGRAREDLPRIPAKAPVDKKLLKDAQLRLNLMRPAHQAPKYQAAVPAKKKGLLGAIRTQAREQRVTPAALPPSRIASTSTASAGPSHAAPRMVSQQLQRMQSSSSPSSDDEAESGHGLKALMALEVDSRANVQKRPKMQNLAAVAPAKTLPEKETADHIQKRLRPDMSYLYRTMLKWDPRYRGQQHFHEKLSRIPARFGSTQKYHLALIVLFLQGLWDEVLAKFDEPSGPNMPVQIVGKWFEDNWINLELSPVGPLPLGWNVNDNDLCLLTSVDGKEQLFVKVDLMKRQGKSAVIKLKIDSSRDVEGLQSQKRWNFRKHANLVTAIREYAGLKSLPALESCIQRGIITGIPAKLPVIPQADIKEAMSDFNVNHPQAQAILGAMQVEGFALIQGPPGTGKTKTISGLVGKFMSERKHSIRTDRPGQTTSAKLLVCAPSNAAIDEVTKRLKVGVPLGRGHIFKPKIVRIGAEASMNAAVVDVGLDALVEARMSAFKAAKGGDKGGSEISKAEAALDQIRQDREAKQKDLQILGDADPERKKILEADLQRLVTQRLAKSAALNKARDAARDFGRQIDAARREARDKIIEEADIICATLAGAGHDSLKPFDFGTVIIDEAAQAIELSTLIPLKYRCTRCILVGDPKQLPPTVTSQAIESLGYNESLFVRLCKDQPDSVHLLSIQYRMHPDISQLPSKVFYDGKLTDGPDMAVKTIAPWHSNPYLGTYRFFDVKGSEQRRGTSVVNIQEIDSILSLYRGLRQSFGSSDRLFGKIGVVTMYKEQSNELRRRFQDSFGQIAFDDIDFNTVDGFQGQEKEIIILSTVRSGPTLESIGFLKDRRRMNVALTRAKCSLFIFGNAETLERGNVDWRYIVGNARERGFLIEYEHGMFLKPVEKIQDLKSSASDRKHKINSNFKPIPNDPSSFSSSDVTKPIKIDRPPSIKPTSAVPSTLPTPKAIKRPAPVSSGSGASSPLISSSSDDDDEVMEVAGPSKMEAKTEKKNKKRKVEDDRGELKPAVVGNGSMATTSKKTSNGIHMDRGKERVVSNPGRCLLDPPPDPQPTKPRISLPNPSRTGDTAAVIKSDSKTSTKRKRLPRDSSSESGECTPPNASESESKDESDGSDMDLDEDDGDNGGLNKVSGPGQNGETGAKANGKRSGDDGHGPAHRPAGTGNGFGGGPSRPVEVDSSIFISKKKKQKRSTDQDSDTSRPPPPDEVPPPPPPSSPLPLPVPIPRPSAQFRPPMAGTAGHGIPTRPNHHNHNQNNHRYQREQQRIHQQQQRPQPRQQHQGPRPGPGEYPYAVRPRPHVPAHLPTNPNLTSNASYQQQQQRPPAVTPVYPGPRRQGYRPGGMNGYGNGK